MNVKLFYSMNDASKLAFWERKLKEYDALLQQRIEIQIKARTTRLYSTDAIRLCNLFLEDAGRHQILQVLIQLKHLLIPISMEIIK